MAAIVNIEDHSITVVEILLHGLEVGVFPLKGIPIRLDRTPHEVISVDITSIAAKPRIQILRCGVLVVDFASAIIQYHGDRGHQAASTANSVCQACAKLIFCPSLIALLENWICYCAAGYSCH